RSSAPISAAAGWGATTTPRILTGFTPEGTPLVGRWHGYTAGDGLSPAAAPGFDPGRVAGGAGRARRSRSDGRAVAGRVLQNASGGARVAGPYEPGRRWAGQYPGPRRPRQGRTGLRREPLSILALRARHARAGLRRICRELHPHLPRRDKRLPRRRLRHRRHARRGLAAPSALRAHHPPLEDARPDPARARARTPGL